MTSALQQAMLKTANGWASFSSCSSGEVAHESGELGQGIFSHYFCEGLEGKASNETGQVTFDRLVDYVKTSVGNWSDEQSQRQTPHVQSDLSGMLVLSTVTRVPEAAPADLAHPLEVLRFGIDKRLSETAEDARNLTFTDDEECGSIFQLVERSVREMAQGFSHPSLVISVSEGGPLQEFGGRPRGEFNADVREKKVQREYKGPTHGVQVQFSSAEVVLPRTVLTVGVSRFSFFYWLWYLHECTQEQLQGSFTADPRFTKGFFTFKPRAALDGRKVEKAVNELLKRACDDILSWAEQLGKFVDTRLGPLREIGKIVE